MKYILNFVTELLLNNSAIFFNEDFKKLICDQTNLYVRQENPNSTFSLDFSLYQNFTAASLLMSLFGLNCSRQFWAAESRLPIIADCLSRNYFDFVKSYLHFVDNSQQSGNSSRGFKFMPLIIHFNSVCSTLSKTEKLSIDKQILPTKTRKTKLRQYNPLKPKKKWGFKIFMITDATGLVYKIEFYLGKDSENIVQLGASGSVVLRLAEVVPKHKNHKLIFENWFSSLELFKVLRKDRIFALATFNLRRIQSLEFPADEQLKRGGRGHLVEKQCTVDNQVVSAVKWFDNRGVHLISNFVGSQPMTSIQRYDRISRQFISISCPAAIKEYNAFMGSIDAFDSYIALYRTKLKSTKKYYLKLYFHMLDMMVINSWLLYRREELHSGTPRKSLMKLWDLKYQTAQTLYRFQTTLKRSRFSRVSADILEKKRRVQLRSCIR